MVCSAPLLDMVRYEQFGLGETWNDEYGTAADPERARLAARLLAVPPRARRASSYPAVLFTVFDGDTRVDPLHARKMCAALQHATAAPAGRGRGPVLLRRETDVGHGARVGQPYGRAVGGDAVLRRLADRPGLTAGTTREAAARRGWPSSVPGKPRSGLCWFHGFPIG